MQEARVVGGSQTEDDEFPFFILWGGCGASLIHGDIALSAAHVSCVQRVVSGGCQLSIEHLTFHSDSRFRCNIPVVRNVRRLRDKTIT